MVSTCIAMISVIAGIGGGVIFTPIMLAFTNVNSLVVRATGIIVAMFSSPISIGVFIKKGLVNFRLSLIMAISQSFGALFGATMAVRAATEAGVVGEGFLRLSLGIILFLLVIYFLSGGKKLEWPVVKHVDNLTSILKLDHRFYEESEGVVHDYKVKRAALGIFLIFLIGIIGGFFGMGGGWAIAPVLNMGMGMPLKLAAVNSGFILGLSGGVSVWPFVFAGGIIPLFVLPWLAGQIVGGFVGAHLLARVKASVVRVILIGIMFYTSFTLLSRGFEMIGAIGRIPAIVDVLVFASTMIGVCFIIVRRKV